MFSANSRFPELRDYSEKQRESILQRARYNVFKIKGNCLIKNKPIDACHLCLPEQVLQ